MSDQKQMPIYVVIHKPTGTKRLVRAANEGRARKHVVGETIAVSRASQTDLVELVGAGTKVEQATS